MLVGCSEPSGFQDVENITSIDYYFDNGNNRYNYSFDLEKGVFYFCFDFEKLEDSPEYKLEKSENEAIRETLGPAGKWIGDYRYTSAGRNYPQSYNIVINFADGTNCVFKGTSANGKKWPKGFEELKSTLDGIVQKRVEESEYNRVD